MTDSNAKKLAQLLDGNGDVLIDNLDNVNTNLVADTTPQLGGDLDLNSNDITGTGQIDLSSNTDALGLPKGTTAQRPGSPTVGYTRMNTDSGSLEFWDGSSWIATNAIPSVDGVSGNIVNGIATELTLTLTDNTDEVSVIYSEGGVSIATQTNQSVTSGSLTVTVPSDVYGQTVGDTISVSIENSDGNPSSNAVTKTVIAAPSGGTITTSGDYRIHSFTSSSNFVIPTGLSPDVEYLIVGGGGAGGGSDAGGGGGAGGYQTGTAPSVSAGTYSIVVGGGGSGNPSGQGGDGQLSSFQAVPTQSTGGGGGGKGNSGSQNGRPGASGGGGGWGRRTGGSGTPGLGNPGGYGNGSNVGQGPSTSGGGGGGASQAGAGTDGAPTSTIGNGGNGTESTITGSPVYYAGGGGAGTDAVLSTGGQGGGGVGGRGSPATNAVGGQSNRGGGGGGGRGYGGGESSNGGSGIVIVRYDTTSLQVDNQMAHFAKVLDGIVQKVIVAEQDFIDNFIDQTPGVWIQTSYNTIGGIHYTIEEDGTRVESVDQSKSLRYNYAFVGGHYDANTDAFYAPQPYSSWRLDETTFLWKSPVEIPTQEQLEYDDNGETKTYILFWNEDNIRWEGKEPEGDITVYWNPDNSSWVDIV